MVPETRIDSTIEELNGLLGDVTPYKLALVDPLEVEHVERNARFMSGETMKQLAANVAEDGNLAGVPFCWRKDDGSYVVLSGNHRRDAAVEAGVEKIIILYTDEDLSRSQAVAIQLSHNAIVGEDNPAVLEELWNEIDDYQYKVYSGLDEDYIHTLEPVEFINIKDENIRMEELSLIFVSPEIDYIQEIVEKLGVVGRRRFLADHREWEPFWETFLDFKASANVINSSTAFTLLAEIAREWLEENGEHYAREQNV